ncbi:MAG: TetR/AcrR family transcriptional regulator [Flavobacteriales bacterium]
MTRTKSGDKKQAIFDATLRCVLRTGFGGLKMAAVAKEARVATGTVYLYFRNKEDLINALLLHVKAEIHTAMMQDVETDDPFFTAFKKSMINYIDFCYGSPEKMIFIEQFYRSSYLYPETAAEIEQLALPVLNMLRSARNEMLIKDIDRELMLRQLLGASNEIIKYCIDSGRPITKLLREQILDMLWSSIRR